MIGAAGATGAIGATGVAGTFIASAEAVVTICDEVGTSTTGLAVFFRINSSGIFVAILLNAEYLVCQHSRLCMLISQCIERRIRIAFLRKIQIQTRQQIQES